jgi:hypothetical protein
MGFNPFQDTKSNRLACDAPCWFILEMDAGEVLAVERLSALMVNTLSRLLLARRRSAEARVLRPRRRGADRR